MEVKVIDSLKRAVETLEAEENITAYAVDKTYYTGAQLVEKFADKVKGSMEVSEDGIFDENHFEAIPLTGEVSSDLMDVINFPVSDNAKHELIYRAIRALAALYAVYDNRNALGNEWVRKWLPDCEEYFGEDDSFAEDKALMDVQEALFDHCKQVALDSETKETSVAEFNTSYRIGDEDHEVSIRCIYGDWFGLVDGSNYLPISVDCLKKILNDFASFSAWQEVTEM